MESLESAAVRPRQAHYQAALRPDMRCNTHSKGLSKFLPASIHRFWPRPCSYRAFIRAVLLLNRDRADWFCCHRCHFPSSAVNLFQSLALHLQLQLGIFLEDLRVSLAQHLSHPFIRHSSCTQPRSVSGPKVVDAEIRDF